MPDRISLPEELHVLLIDRANTAPHQLNDRAVQHAFAGAALMELALRERIDTDPEQLHVLDARPLGDEILDPILAAVASEQQTHTRTSAWVTRLAGAEIANRLRRATAERLVQRQIATVDPGGLLSLNPRVTRTGRYPGIARPAGEDIAVRITNVLVNEDIPSPEEAMLIGIADACGLLEKLLTSKERSACEARISTVRDLDLIARAVRDAIAAGSTPEQPTPAWRHTRNLWRSRTTAAKPPMAPGAIPLAGHSLKLRRTFTRQLAEWYQALGPVFRVREMGTELTVVVGPEANRFCQKHGRSLFRSQPVFDAMVKELGANRIVVSMDGTDHFNVRRTIAPGFSRERYLAKLEEIKALILQELPEEAKGTGIDVFNQISGKAIGYACTGYAPSTGEVQDIDFWLRRVFQSTMMRSVPSLMQRTPRARRARAGFLGVFDKIMVARANTREERDEGSAIDALFELHQTNPQLMPEDELKLSCLAPIFAGLHTTSNASSCAMYLLLKHPETLARARVEADALYAGTGPCEDKMKHLDVIQRVVFETLRLYNPFGTLYREAINSFEFGGYTVEAGARMAIATAVPHYCAEFFADPEAFDIERYAPGRAEHHKPGVYMPFGFGTHRCLGASIAETHIMMTIATILHHRNIAMDPPDYEMRGIFDGVPGPTRRFQIAFSTRRPTTKVQMPSAPAVVSRFLSWNPPVIWPDCSGDGLPGMTEQTGHVAVAMEVSVTAAV